MFAAEGGGSVNSLYRRFFSWARYVVGNANASSDMIFFKKNHWLRKKIVSEAVDKTRPTIFKVLDRDGSAIVRRDTVVEYALPIVATDKDFPFFSSFRK